MNFFVLRLGRDDRVAEQPPTTTGGVCYSGYNSAITTIPIKSAEMYLFYWRKEY